MKLSLSTAFLSLLLQTAFAKEERTFLRRTSAITSEVNVMENGRRLVIHFNAELEHEECLQKLKAYPHDRVSIVHKLETVNAYAVSISPDDDTTLQSLEDEDCFDIYSDPVRVPMYIKDSIKVENGRNLQWWGNQQDVPYGIDMVKSQQVWSEFGVRGSGVKVCVMDTGIKSNHEDFLTQNLSGYSGKDAVTPWDDDGNGHGTHVSGTIAAADNDDGVVGVAPDAEIYTVRVFDSSGYFFGSDVVAAAEACRDAGAQIISMSLGGPSYDGDEKQVFEQLWDQGILSIAAAGNDGDDDYSFPASYERVMSVAAVNSNKNHASFSQYNDRVDIAAPGVNVRSTWNNGKYSSISGTSMATPHVSGVAALLLSKEPNATPQDLYNVITSTAQNPDSSGRDDYFGHGIINALDAMTALVNGDTGGPGNGGGGGGGNTIECQNNQVALDFEITTDNYGYETSWKLTDDKDSGSIVDQEAEGDMGNNKKSRVQKCMNNNECYTLTIYDSYGDGICCGNSNPGYVVKVDGSTIAQTQDFTYEIQIPNIGKNCGNGGGPTEPSPTNPPGTSPTPPPVPAPTPFPTPPPTEQEECCFLIWCWGC